MGGVDEALENELAAMVAIPAAARDIGLRGGMGEERVDGLGGGEGAGALGADPDPGAVPGMGGGGGGWMAIELALFCACPCAPPVMAWVTEARVPGWMTVDLRDGGTGGGGALFMVKKVRKGGRLG